MVLASQPFPSRLDIQLFGHNDVERMLDNANVASTSKHPTKVVTC